MAFPRASWVIDRFHVQRLAWDAVQEIRIKHQWDAINAETEAREAAKLEGRKYTAERFENGDTLKELLARGLYALFKSPEKWIDTQRTRAGMLFGLYPDLKQAYWLSQNLRDKRSTNASVESINSKIKAFRAKLHGVNDTKFFIFRLCKIYA